MTTPQHRHLAIIPLAVVLAHGYAINCRAKTPGPVAEPVILFDFDPATVGSTWRFDQSHGAAASLGEGRTRPQGTRGGCLRLQVHRPGAKLHTYAHRIPADWAGFEALRLRVYRPPEDAERMPAVTVEVWLSEVDDNAAFWHRVDLEGDGWIEVDLPLRWFRWGEGRVPQWDQLDHFGIVFRQPGIYALDEISLIPVDGAGRAHLYPSPAELAELVGDLATEVQAIERDGIALISAVPDLDAEQLLTHLAEVRVAVLTDLPFLVPPDRPIPLVILPDHEAFLAYVDRLAAAFGGEVSPPEGTGFTMAGIAVSSWKTEAGTLRPVYTHEYVHGLLSASALLPNHQEWLQEGLATRYQIRFHPQADIAGVILDGMSRPGRHKPLAELCDGGAIDQDRYWQAMTLVDLLVEHERYVPHFERLLQGFRDAGFTDLRPHVGTVLGVTWAELEQDWREDVGSRYGAGAGE